MSGPVLAPKPTLAQLIDTYRNAIIAELKAQEAAHDAVDAMHLATDRLDLASSRRRNAVAVLLAGILDDGEPPS